MSRPTASELRAMIRVWTVAKTRWMEIVLADPRSEEFQRLRPEHEARHAAFIKADAELLAMGMRTL